MEYKVFKCPYCGEEYKVKADFPLSKAKCNKFCRKPYFDIVFEDLPSENLPEFKASTSIIVAAMFGTPEYVQYLLDNGGAVNEEDPITDLPIHAAAHHTKYLEVIQILVDYGADVNVENEMGDCPIHYAAQNFCLQIISKLVELGAALIKR